jgi:two-component system, chemotaxis family, protein-glutamate methylesterase/glutaminase
MRTSNPSGTRRSGRPIQVLVVDDSAVVRETLTSILSQEPEMLVTTASDPIIALEKMKKIQPHVVVLDVFMPRMNGLEFCVS